MNAPITIENLGNALIEYSFGILTPNGAYLLGRFPQSAKLIKRDSIANITAYVPNKTEFTSIKGSKEVLNVNPKSIIGVRTFRFGEHKPTRTGLMCSIDVPSRAITVNISDVKFSSFDVIAKEERSGVVSVFLLDRDGIRYAPFYGWIWYSE